MGLVKVYHFKGYDIGSDQTMLSPRAATLDTIRNWEQGKRHPTGAARALLKVLDRVPKAALGALD